MTKQKLLKIKVGDVYIDGKTYGVYQTAWRKESKDGKPYYEVKKIMFPSEIEIKGKELKIEMEDM